MAESRYDLAKGLVALVDESQKGLEIDFGLQATTTGRIPDDELHCGLLDRIQNLVEHRETLVNTAVFAQDLDHRIRAFTQSSEQLHQLQSKLDLEGYMTGLHNLQGISAQVFEGFSFLFFLFFISFSYSLFSE